MKVYPDKELGGFLIKTCLKAGCRKKALIYGGHVHSDINFKRSVTAGWCSEACSRALKTAPCKMFRGGCYGVNRLRGFTK